MITCFREWPAAAATAQDIRVSGRLPSGTPRWYSSGRAALFNTLPRFDLPRDAEILMPAYIAAGVIEPVRKLGLAVRFYRTNSSLLFDEQSLIDDLSRREKARALIVLHPMGRAQSIERLAEICGKRGIALIEDCAQGLFSRRPNGELLGTLGDAALFSLPKFLGTVDGAIVVTRRPAALNSPDAGGRPLSVRAAGAWHKAHLIANRCLNSNPFPVLDGLLLGVSGYFHERYYALAGGDLRAAAPARSTMRTWNRLDADAFIRRRRRNIDFLYSALKTDALQFVYPNDNPGWIPLAVPALVKGMERAAAQQKARHGGVFLAALSQRWDYLPDDPEFSAERDYLDNHVLIPINEHIDGPRMERLVKTLNELRK